MVVDLYVVCVLFFGSVLRYGSFLQCRHLPQFAVRQSRTAYQVTGQLWDHVVFIF